LILEIQVRTEGRKNEFHILKPSGSEMANCGNVVRHPPPVLPPHHARQITSSLRGRGRGVATRKAVYE